MNQKHFEKILAITILRDSPTLEASNIILGLRMLYYVSSELKNFTYKFFQQILDKLIDLVNDGEEPIPTHAIKCLQNFVFNQKLLQNSYPKLLDLLNVLIKNLTKYISVYTDDTLIPVPSTHDQIETFIDDFDRSSIYMNKMDEKELNVPKFDILDLIDMGVISKSSQQKFHYMELINCLINLINNNELVKNQDLCTLLYRCLNVSKARSDACTAVALQIIYTLMDDSEIFAKFMSADILYRVLAVPCYLTSSCYAVKIIFKIFEACKDDILNDDANIVKLMTDYTLRSIANLVDDVGLNALNCFMGYLTLSDLIEMEALPNIIRAFHQLEFYKAAKNILNNDIKKNYRLLKKNFSQIEIFCRLVSFYLSQNLIQLNPDLNHGQYNKMNLVDINKIIHNLVQKQEKSGCIHVTDPSMSNQIGRDLFEILFVIIRCIYTAKPNRNTRHLYQWISRIFNMCILIKDVRDLMLENFDCYPKHPHHNRNILSILMLILDDYFFDYKWIHFLPYQIISNLMMRCCESFERYQFCLGELKTDPSAEHSNISEILKPDSHKIIDELMASSFMLYAVNSFGDIVQPNIPNKYSLYLIKSLMILSENKRVSGLLSQNRYFYSKIFKDYLKKLKKPGSKKNENNELIKYAEILNKKMEDLRCTHDVLFDYDLPVSKKKKWDHKPEPTQPFGDLRIYLEQGSTIISHADENMLVKNKDTISSDDKKRGIQKDIPSYEINMTSKDNIQQLHSRKFQSIKKYYYKASRKSDVIKILKDDSILIADGNIIMRFCGNSFSPKLNLEFEKTTHLVDSFNGDLIMGCAKSSDETKCFMWKYDSILGESILIDPCTTFENICQTQFSHDDKNIVGINSNFDVDVIDIETRGNKSELKNPNRKYYFNGNSPQINSNSTLVLSNGELYSPSTGKLIHVLDRLEYFQSGIFSVSENEVIYGQELWDLRTFKILQQIPKLETCFLRRTHNDNVYLGYEYTLRQRYCEDPYASSHAIRKHSGFDMFKLVDPLTLMLFTKWTLANSCKILQRTKKSIFPAMLLK
ncbi:Protein VPRBP [Thelohanellus kitauei]|uniref:Protein VPRBP n=1 Tax=Thelohanellus kitauei TaxID=669202 RepID=A0A0C2NER4_THEKT|nr:Protein VPRBP [Thelohanellus kitauei]